MAEDKPLTPGTRPAEAPPVGNGQFAAGPPPGHVVPLSRPEAARPSESKPDEPKDSFREIIETVVFVVVLVLLLKTFLAEAFVIPTGSMATTLLGYNIDVKCQKCGYTFPVNASKQEDPQEGRPQQVVGCTCPNCAFFNR